MLDCIGPSSFDAHTHTTEIIYGRLSPWLQPKLLAAKP